METTRTFETRLKISEQENELLRANAELFAHVKHSLFAEIASGKTPGELKSTYLTRYKITARQFNSVRVLIEGKISSIKSLRPAQIIEKKSRIESLETKIKKLIKSNASPEVIHGKKRRLKQQETELHQLEEDEKQENESNEKTDMVYTHDDGKSGHFSFLFLLISFQQDLGNTGNTASF